MKNNSTSSLLFNKPEFKSSTGIAELLRITVTPAHTKVDFGYQTTDYYIKGGWVRIGKNTFIRIISTGEKLLMRSSDNIPMAPNRLDFKTTKDWLYFSLYFPPLPLNTEEIDLIEAEKGNASDFNYYKIKLNPKSAIKLR